MSSEKKPSDLDYFVFNDEFPLHSNAGILNIGNMGSGKSYFTYKYLVPIYLKYGGIKTLLIASRTGKFDATTAGALENQIYKEVLIYFIKIEEAFSCCQMLRADTYINSYLQQIMNIKEDADLIKIRKDLIQQIKESSQSEFGVIKHEMEKLLNIIDKKLIHMEIEEVKDWAEMKFNTGTKLTFNPVLVILDDYAGDGELMKRNTSIYHLEILRRHLHTTLIINTQSLTSVSTDIRRFADTFVCFSTMSEADAKLLKFRLPIKYSMKQLMDTFYEIAEQEDRNKRVLVLFTSPGMARLVSGLPECVLNSV